MGYLLLTIFILGVCSAPAAETIEFSHKAHAPVKLECTFCHRDAKAGGRAGLPKVAQCMTCHATLPRTTEALERLAAFPSDASPFTVEFNKLPDFVIFRHQRHAEAGIDCTTCHGARYSEVRPRPAVPLTMKGCVDCHKPRQAKAACDTCHELGQ